MNSSFNIKKLVMSLAAVAVSAGLIAWLVGRVDKQQVSQIWQAADRRWLGVALVLTCCVPVFAVTRWLGVLRAQGIKLSFMVALRAVLMANILNSFLPSKGGDIVKATYIRNHGGLTLGFGTVILERLIDLMVLSLIGLPCSIYTHTGWGIGASGVLLTIVVGVIITATVLPIEKLPLPKKMKLKFLDLQQVFPKWLKRPGCMVQTFAGSICVWSIAGFTIVCLIEAFGLELSWLNAYAIFPVGVLAGLVPASVSGIGIRDTVFTQLLVAAGVSTEGAAMVAMGYTVYAYWLLSLISLPAAGMQLYQTMLGTTDSDELKS